MTNPEPPGPSNSLLILGKKDAKLKAQWEKEFGIWSYWKASFNEHQHNIVKKYIIDINPVYSSGV